MGELLANINANTTYLQSESKNLSAEINVVNTALNSKNISSLTTVANFGALPNVSTQLTNINKINENDFTGEAEKVIQSV